MYLILFLFIPIFLILLLRYLFVRNQLTVSAKAERVLLVSGAVTFLLMIVSYQMAKYDLYFAGYRTTTYIMFSASFFVLLYYLLGGVPSPKLQGLQFIKFALSLVLLINAFFVTDEFTFRFSKNLIYSDGKYRIQKVDGFMSGIQYELWVNEGFFDRAYRLEFRKWTIVDSVDINEIGSDSVIINIYHHDTDYLPSPDKIRIKL